MHVFGAYIVWKYVSRQRFLRRIRIARITPEELKAKLDAVGEKIAKLGLQRGPVNSAAGVNQAYLFELPPEAARVIAAEVDLLASRSRLPHDSAGSFRGNGTAKKNR